MRRGPRIGGAVLLVALLALGACKQEEVEVVDTVRAIKTFKVEELAFGQARKFSGVIAASKTSSLSFEIAGNVQSLQAELGDRVSKDQILAVLDKTPFELDLKATQAALSDAKAAAEQAQLEHDRQRKLFEKKWISKAALDQAVSTYQSAKSNVDLATAKVGIARRNLDNTVLKAPFDGVISARLVDPFVGVTAGQAIYEMHAEGELEVAVNIPETVLPRISTGQAVDVTFPTNPSLKLAGHVSHIGSVAQEANAFPVKIALADVPPTIRPGMTSEATFLLPDDELLPIFLVPLSAIVPAEESHEGYVYVYDPESSTVHKTRIYARGVQNNMVELTEGVANGDLIAAAGISFLRDGQEVKLWNP